MERLTAEDRSHNTVPQALSLREYQPVLPKAAIISQTAEEHDFLA